MRLGMNRRAKIRLFPAYTRPKFEKANKILSFSLAVMIFMGGFVIVYSHIKPMIVSVASTKAKYIATMAINSAVNEEVSKANYTYDDLAIISRDESGKVTSVASNVTNINILKTNIANTVQQKINDIQDTDSGIPLGALLGSRMFSGIGPKINIKMVAGGYATVDFKNSFTTAGINQTKHEVIAEINANVGMLMPIGYEGIDVKTDMPVVQTVIVGEVPGSYTSVEGTEASPPDNVLQLAN